MPWKAWNAALALPGAPGRAMRAESLGKIKCCSFIWQHRLLAAGSLGRHRRSAGGEGGQEQVEEGQGRETL